MAHRRQKTGLRRVRALGKSALLFGQLERMPAPDAPAIGTECERQSQRGGDGIGGPCPWRRPRRRGNTQAQGRQRRAPDTGHTGGAQLESIVARRQLRKLTLTGNAGIQPFALETIEPPLITIRRGIGIAQRPCRDTQIAITPVQCDFSGRRIKRDIVAVATHAYTVEHERRSLRIFHNAQRCKSDDAGKRAAEDAAIGALQQRLAVEFGAGQNVACDELADLARRRIGAPQAARAAHPDLAGGIHAHAAHAQGRPAIDRAEALDRLQHTFAVGVVRKRAQRVQP